jgi:hypothetical protein
MSSFTKIVNFAGNVGELNVSNVSAQNVNTAYEQKVVGYTPRELHDAPGANTFALNRTLNKKNLEDPLVLPVNALPVFVSVIAMPRSGSTFSVSGSFEVGPSVNPASSSAEFFSYPDFSLASSFHRSFNFGQTAGYTDPRYVVMTADYEADCVFKVVITYRLV